MEVGFSVKDKLYAMCDFTVICEDPAMVEKALDDIGENVCAEDLYMRLREKFGRKNVKAVGLNSVDNIESEREYEFWDWKE